MEKQANIENLAHAAGLSNAKKETCWLAYEKLKN